MALEPVSRAASPCWHLCVSMQLSTWLSAAVSVGVLACSVGAVAFAACCISGVCVYTGGVND